MFTINDCRTQGSSRLFVKARAAAEHKLSLYRQATCNGNLSYSSILRATLSKYTVYHREFLERNELHKLEVLVAVHDINGTIQLLTCVSRDIIEFLVSCALFQLGTEYINHELHKLGNTITVRKQGKAEQVGKPLFNVVVAGQQTSYYVQYFTQTDELIWLCNHMVTICGVDVLVDQERLATKECYDRMLQLLVDTENVITANDTRSTKEKLLQLIQEYPYAKL